MGIIAKVNNSGNIGRATIRSGTKASIISPNFQPKPNVALTELTDTLIVNPENGSVLTFSSESNKYEVKPLSSNNIAITQITGGTF